MAVALVDTPNGQIRVETGSGRVTDVERKPNGRNAKVTIDAAPALREPVTGWADLMDPKIEAMVAAVEASGLPSVICDYRVETFRKPGQPVDVPLERIPTRERVRDLIFIRPAGGSAPSTPGRLNDAAQQRAAGSGDVPDTDDGVGTPPLSAQERPPAVGRDNWTLNRTLDVAQECAEIAYVVVATLYKAGDDFEGRVRRLAERFAKMAADSGSPSRAVALLHLAEARHRLAVDATADQQRAWLDAIEADVQMLLRVSTALVGDVAK